MHWKHLRASEVVCFDKTGTLTNGRFELLSLNVVADAGVKEKVMEGLGRGGKKEGADSNEVDEDQVRERLHRAIAAVEARDSHPI